MIGSVRAHLRQNVVAYLARFVALGGTGAFAATVLVSSDGTISGCVSKKGKHKGTLRVVKPGARCRRGEAAIAFNQRGQTGAKGQEGAPGSPDTPSQVLEKLKQVDGDGSALDSDLLDGHETAFFQRRGATTSCITGKRVTGIDAGGDVTCVTDDTAPTGPAGGALTGTYPNPQLAQTPFRRLSGTQACGGSPFSGQSIPNNAETVMTYPNFGGLSWPPSGEPCTDTEQRLVVPRPGTYVIAAGVLWPANPTGQRGL